MPLSVVTFPCCRDHDLFWPLGYHADAIQRGRVDEASWLNLDERPRVLTKRR